MVCSRLISSPGDDTNLRFSGDTPVFIGARGDTAETTRRIPKDMERTTGLDEPASRCLSDVRFTVVRRVSPRAAGKRKSFPQSKSLRFYRE